MLVVATLMFTVVLAFSALAIDVGFYTHTRTKLQADADAMVLGGAQELCSTADCAVNARDVAEGLQTPNGVRDTDRVSVSTSTDCEGSPITSYNKISARITRHDPSFLARVLGITGADVSACATAGRFAFGGSNGVRPFALEDNCIANLDYSETVVIKYDSSTTRNCDSDTGNYAAVAIDGTGASVYRTTIKFGSDGLVCIEGSTGCCPTLESGCVGVYHIDTEPGNMIGPTRDGIDYLIENTPSDCDTWDKVVSLDASGNATIASNCRPWADGYTGATRVIIIPVVNGLWDQTGRHTVTIVDFAVLFLDGYDGSCGGNTCDVNARFIKMIASLPDAVEGPAGALSDITIVSLVE
jgi:hypothetical protein